jgi:predicted transcriptional regulator
MRATCPALLILLDFITLTNVWSGVRIMKLLIIHISPASFYFLALYSNTTILCSCKVMRLQKLAAAFKYLVKALTEQNHTHEEIKGTLNSENVCYPAV